MKPNNSCPVKLYQKVKFDPFYGLILREYKDNTEDIVIGNITYINHNNNWFLAEYINPNGLKIGTSTPEICARILSWEFSTRER